MAASTRAKDEGAFIRPTQGLKVRQPGGVMNVNLENIGGRILYMEEMNGHKNRMREIRPVISLQPPWGHAEAAHPPKPAKTAPKSAKKSSMAKARGGSTGVQGGGAVPKAAKRTGSAGYQAVSAEEPEHVTREFDVTILNEDHQALYHDFVRMLCLMGNDDSRAILEQAYRESEEKKLLSGYTGIFPILDHEDEEDVFVGEPPNATLDTSHATSNRDTSATPSDMPTSTQSSPASTEQTTATSATPASEDS